MVDDKDDQDDQDDNPLPRISIDRYKAKKKLSRVIDPPPAFVEESEGQDW
jgi:hypothetical protein